MKQTASLGVLSPNRRLSPNYMALYHRKRNFWQSPLCESQIQMSNYEAADFFWQGEITKTEFLICGAHSSYHRRRTALQSYPTFYSTGNAFTVGNFAKSNCSMAATILFLSATNFGEGPQVFKQRVTAVWLPRFCFLVLQILGRGHRSLTPLHEQCV
jgi:hypothetical protein